MFMFGLANTAPVLGLLYFNNGSGGVLWIGEGEVTASKLDDGRIQVTLPFVSYDNVCLLSSKSIFT